MTTLLPYLLSHRSRLAAFTASQAALTNTTTSTTASQAAATTTSQPATASTTGRRKGGISDSAHPTSEFEQVLEGGLSSAYRDGKGQEEEAPGSPVHSRPQEFLAGLQPEQRHQLAVLVDTAILKVPLTPQYSCCNKGIASCCIVLTTTLIWFNSVVAVFSLKFALCCWFAQILCVSLLRLEMMVVNLSVVCGLSTETRHWHRNHILHQNTCQPISQLLCIILECQMARHEALCIGIAGYAGHGRHRCPAALCSAFK